MKKGKQSDKAKLDRLVDSVIDDIQGMRDEEVLELAMETFGGIEPVVKKFNSIVEQAENIARKIKFNEAQEKLKTNIQIPHSSKIVSLPIDRKKGILAMVQKNRGITTLAARNATDSEADIDSMLEDLVELGVIDEDGNPL